jgi:hypothetical protein
VVPGSLKILTFRGCCPHLHGPYCIVYHSTEGNTVQDVLTAYRNSGNCPYFTAGDGEIEQHTAIDQGATALEPAD